MEKNNGDFSLAFYRKRLIIWNRKFLWYFLILFELIGNMEVFLPIEHLRTIFRFKFPEWTLSSSLSWKRSLYLVFWSCCSVFGPQLYQGLWGFDQFGGQRKTWFLNFGGLNQEIDFLILAFGAWSTKHQELQMSPVYKWVR